MHSPLKLLREKFTHGERMSCERREDESRFFFFLICKLIYYMTAKKISKIYKIETKFKGTPTQYFLNKVYLSLDNFIILLHKFK